MPAAPARFSTATDCFHLSVSFAATVRAEMSVPPPGGKGTMKVTGFAGYVCAAASTHQKNRDSPHLFIAPLEDRFCLLDDRTAFLRLERGEAGGPGLAILVVRQPRRLAPAPGRMLGTRAAPEDVHVHAPVVERALFPALGRRGVVQRPVARLEVVDAAALELRQDVDHRAADRADEEAPMRELDGGELALLPHVARRVHDQVAAAGAVEEHHLRQHYRAPRSFVNHARHHCGCSFASLAILPKISIQCS